MIVLIVLSMESPKDQSSCDEVSARAVPYHRSSLLCTSCNISEKGFKLGNVVISGLLFADDLVIVARSSSALKSLLSLVKTGFDKLKLTINVQKSQVISPADDVWEVVDESGLPVLTLDQVEQYKYLGTWTYSSMYRTVVEKQKLALKTANKYKSSCIHVSRMGPDVVDVALCTWSNVAIPAILVGCEMIPFCETRIAEIERVQAASLYRVYVRVT